MRYILILAIIAQMAVAQDDLYSSLNHSSYEPSYFAMVLGLAVVIGLVYLTAILYKKLTKIKLDDVTDDKFAIQILSSTSLGQNKNLYVIKVDSSYSLIGATNSTITHIKDLGGNYEN